MIRMLRRLAVLLALGLAFASPAGARDLGPMTADERAKVAECVVLRDARCVLEVLAGRSLEEGYLPLGPTAAEGLRQRAYVLSVAVQVRDPEMSVRLADEISAYADPLDPLGREIRRMVAKTAFLFGEPERFLSFVGEDDTAEGRAFAALAAVEDVVTFGYPPRVIAERFAALGPALTALDAELAPAMELARALADGRTPSAAAVAALEERFLSRFAAARAILPLMAALGEGAVAAEAVRLAPQLADGAWGLEAMGVVGRGFATDIDELERALETQPTVALVDLATARLFQERMSRPPPARRQELDRAAVSLAMTPIRTGAAWTTLFAPEEMHTMLALLERAGRLDLQVDYVRGLARTVLPRERMLFLAAFQPEQVVHPGLRHALTEPETAGPRLTVAAFRGQAEQAAGLADSLGWSTATIAALIEAAFLFALDAPEM